MTNNRTDGLQFKWRICGFGLFELPRTSDQKGSSGWRFLIPYCSIVIPLTLLSAWLLVSKPQAVKAEPVELSTKTES